MYVTQLIDEENKMKNWKILIKVELIKDFNSRAVYNSYEFIK